MDEHNVYSKICYLLFYSFLLYLYSLLFSFFLKTSFGSLLFSPFCHPIAWSEGRSFKLSIIKNHWPLQVGHLERQQSYKFVGIIIVVMYFISFILESHKTCRIFFRIQLLWRYFLCLSKGSQILSWPKRFFIFI